MKTTLALTAAALTCLTLAGCDPAPSPQPAGTEQPKENPKADECPRADGAPCK